MNSDFSEARLTLLSLVSTFNFMERFKSFIVTHWKKLGISFLFFSAYLADRGVIWARAVMDLFFFTIIFLPVLIVLGIIVLTILSPHPNIPQTTPSHTDKPLNDHA
ncbi:hypothetical protein [Desulfovulcanus sp.]